MSHKIVKINLLKKKLPDTEFFYLKKDLKTFGDIVSHTSNIISKNIEYFLPVNLLLSAVDSMTVLYPMLERSCDAGMIARQNYNILQARYLSGHFSAQLVEIIDYLIWVKALYPAALNKDRLRFRNQIYRKISEFISSKSDFHTETEYSPRTFVLELHEVLTDINIKGKIEKLQKGISETETSVENCLDTIVSIFLDPQRDPGQFNTFRDITIASDLAASLLLHLKESNNAALHEDIALAKALKSYFMQVSRYMFSKGADIELCRLFEIIFYLEETAPSFIMHEETIPLLENSVAVFTSYKELLAKNLETAFDPESAELFKAKMKQVYAGKI